MILKENLIEKWADFYMSFLAGSIPASTLRLGSYDRLKPNDNNTWTNNKLG